jgi:hypothetical protein
MVFKGLQHSVLPPHRFQTVLELLLFQTEILLFQIEFIMIPSATLPMLTASSPTTMMAAWQVQPLRCQSTGLRLYQFYVRICRTKRA